MFTLTAERQDGARLTLTQFDSAYKVKYTGFGPVGADIITSALGMVDGEKYNGSRVGRRNIVLTVYIGGNVEANRIRLYQYFAPKSYVKLYYKNGTREVYAEGYVESNEPNQFEANSFNQISIICPKPFLSAIEAIVQDISNEVDMFEFPFSIEEEGTEFSTLDGGGFANMHNSGDVSTGAIFRVFAQSPVVGATIYNAITNEYFKIAGTLEAGDLATINTNAGNKRLTITKSTGEVVNALHRRAAGSTWLQLSVGDNYIAYTADSGDTAMSVSVEHNDLFVGV